jgi:hypothetical protein
MKRLSLLFVPLIPTLVVFLLFPLVIQALEPICFSVSFLGEASEGWTYSEQGSTGGSGTLTYDDGAIRLAHTLPNNVTHFAYANQPLSVDLTDALTITVQFDARTEINIGTPVIAINLWLEYLDGTNDSIFLATINSAPYNHFSYNITGFMKKELVSFGIAAANSSNGGYTSILHIKNIDIDVRGQCSAGGVLCPTVPNFHFVGESSWELSGSAAISSSILSLPPVAAAEQDISGLGQLTYDAVISVTQVAITGTTSLSVTLGTQTYLLIIEEPGLYTATVTGDVSDPQTYRLQNAGAGSVDIDYTCLTTGDKCLAPDNGEFNTSTGWDYYRGAAWNSTGKNTFLPFNPGGDADRSLIVASSMYTMPSVGAGQFLLMSFDARSEHVDSALMGSRVTNGVDTTVEFYAETYPTDYTFEYDIGLLEGEQVAIAFANAVVDPLTGFSAEDDAVLDNVCVFLSDRPANLPTPIDPNQIPPTDLGFEFSCADVDGILASFGVNMQQYRATYATTPSIWDPEDWVPWLVAVFWVILETYICLFLGVVAALFNILEYIINNGLNIFSWFRRSSEGGITWWQAWLNWFRLTFANFSDFFNVTADDWLIWFGLSLLSFALFPGALFTNLGILTLWLSGGLAWLWDAIKQLPGFLLGDGLNGIRSILNTLIGAWNFIWSGVGSVLSSLIDLAVQLWNSSILPLFQLVWNYISSVSLFILPFALFFLFGSTVFTLVWMLISWVWANIFQTINLPITFYRAFDQGANSAAFAYILDCANENFWCSLMAGFQLINQTANHSIVYPAVIVGIIISSILIFWRDIWELFSIRVS